MTPLFKFSLLGLGAASAGGGVICISKREAIKEYFRGPSNQTPAGSGEKLPAASGVQKSSLNTTTDSSTTDTQGTDLNNRGQDSNQGETRSPVSGEHQVDGSKNPIATEDNAVISPQPQPQQTQDLQQQQPPGAPAQERGNLPDNQNQIQQLPPGGPGARDLNPGKPQGQEGESVQGSKVVGGDPKVNPQGQNSNPAGGSQRAGGVVNPGPGLDGAPGPGHDGGADPNTIHQGGEPAPDGTGQPQVEGPNVKVPTGDGDLRGQEKVPGGGGGSLPVEEGSQIEQGSGDPGSRAPAPVPGALPSSTDGDGLPGPGGGAGPIGPSPDGQQPSPGVPKEPSNPAPAKDTTDYQCLFGDGSYDSHPNKKAIKEFLDSMGIKNKHGFQIHDESYDKGFKCAKDMEDEQLTGLKDYMDTVKNSFSAPNTKGDNGPTV